jgi:hypothetical protein
MSGTLGISPIREVGVVGVMRAARFLRGRVEMLRRRGGLTPPLAVPVAVAVTGAVVWATVTLASSWVGA